MPPAYGLALPSSPISMGAAPAMAPPSAPATPGPLIGSPSAQVINIGGFLRTGNVAALQEQEQAENAQFQQQQAQPVIQGLAGRVREFFTIARAGRLVVEQEMLEALLARRGHYTPEKLAKIEEADQPAIYMMVASGKMRQIESLMRDVLVGDGTDKPWTIRPTPEPELPPEAVQAAVQQLMQELQQAMLSGFAPTMQAAQGRLRQIREEIRPLVEEEARKRCERMEHKMDDQLTEGGLPAALDAFITDLATFKTAFMAGPILRNKPRLSWGQDGQLIVENKIVPEWERRDPFDVYPAPWATSIQHGPLVIKHRLSRQALTELIGVEGYSETAIKAVIREFGTHGLREWLAVDSQKAIAEGKLSAQTYNTQLIDALQYFGEASGQILLDWGMDKASVPDPTKEYQVEAWVIGPYVIKAVLNADPLARRPLYSASFQNVPGAVWGNAPYDLMKDCQDMCNAAARSLAANMGISSGPQVGVISSRLPSGEDITSMYPWKIWQFEADPMGSTAQPITFFQPASNANELMSVYEKFSQMADEYTGIPRYMAGFNGGEGGAGRTASGISMMITNASKVIKQVLGNVDNAIEALLDRLYYHNMRYGDDPDLKGDVVIVARGAESMVAKEAAQQRTNEFLQLILSAPMVQQIVGVDGTAEQLRQVARRLDMNPDKIVPSAGRLQMMQAQQLQQQALMAAQGALPAPGGQPPKPGGGENLRNGAPTTDHFSPKGA